MARRSDHTRAELRELIVAEAHRQIEEVGYAAFSAREVAKRIGYSVGTLYNVFDDSNLLLLAVNARTLDLWSADVAAALAAAGGGDRVEALVHSYFAFAQDHRNAWSAIYDHRKPAGEPLPDWYAAALARLLGLMIGEVEKALPENARGDAASLACSLLANVHGHCAFDLDGTFGILGQAHPIDLALARVREAIALRWRQFA